MCTLSHGSDVPPSHDSMRPDDPERPGQLGLSGCGEFLGRQYRGAEA
jgi:hypothetical protein